MFAFCVIFSCSVLSQEIGWEERLRNDQFCVGLDVIELRLNHSSSAGCLVTGEVSEAAGY